ncbi:hypothetical protein FRB96_001361 [Tulasnella sp. 330]|nr:hypothetical protein FRB96_001361 [Tulasnella sp. 330]
MFSSSPAIVFTATLVAKALSATSPVSSTEQAGLLCGINTYGTSGAWTSAYLSDFSTTMSATVGTLAYGLDSLVTATEVTTPVITNSVCNVTTYSAIAAAVSACTNIALTGITVPAGDTLNLSSLKAGTIVTFYGKTTWAYADSDFDMLTIEGKNITIQGAPCSVIDGNGAAWWDGEGSNGGATKPDHMITVEKLTGNSVIKNLYIKNAPTHVFDITKNVGLLVKGVVIDMIDGYKILSSGLDAAHNTDGFDLSSNNNTLVTNSMVINQDDCVAITSGVDNVANNIFCSGGHGLSIGSVGGKSDNTVNGVTFSNSNVVNSENGARIKTNSGTTGTINAVTYSNITMSGITTYGIDVQQDYLNGGPTGTPTNGVTITNLVMSGVTGTVVSTAYDYYILVGTGATVSSWTFTGVSVTGGLKSCNEAAKKNKNDAKALALHIADITERSIRRAVSVSDNGIVDRPLLTNFIHWKQHTDEVAGQLEKLTGLVVFKYTDDRLQVRTFNTKAGYIVSSILPAADASAMAVHSLSGAVTNDAAQTSMRFATPESSSDTADISTPTVVPAQPSKPTHPASDGENTPETSGPKTPPARASGTPPITLIKAIANTGHEAFKLAIPMIPSPAGDIVALMIGVGEQIATIVDVKYSVRLSSWWRLNSPFDPERQGSSISPGYCEQAARPKPMESHILTSENAMALDNCTVKIDGAYRSLDLLINADSYQKLTTLEADGLLDRLGNADNGTTDKAADINDMACLPGTRTAILARIEGWIDNQDSSNRVFWLSGPAGSGKTAVAATIESRRRTKTVMATFYFSRGSESRNKRVVLVIAGQLALWGHGCLKRFIVAAIDANRDLATAHLNIQFEHITAEPIKKMVPGTPPVLIILDALDECEDKAFVRTLLKLILSLDDVSTTVKFLITSRPDDTATVDRDIEAYLWKRLEEVVEDKEGQTWLGPSAVTKLVGLADGLFQWASTVVAYIADGDPSTRLSDIIDSYTPLSSLDNMCGFILRQAAAAQSKARPHLLQDVLGAIAVARKPLTPTELSYLLSDARTIHTITADQIQGEVLRHLQSILVIPTTNKTPRNRQPIHFIHALVDDYLMDTCEDSHFAINTQDHHTEMAYRCLRRMPSNLRRDILNIGDVVLLNEEVEYVQDRLMLLPMGLAYCSLFWAAHLAGSTSSKGKGTRSKQLERDQKKSMAEALDGLCVFAATCLLHWMELLILLSQTSEIAAILHLAGTWLLEHKPEGDERRAVSTLLYDGIHFINDFNDVASTTISPDGKVIVSGSEDGTIWVWDRKTGAARRGAPKGHTEAMFCLAISSDGKTVVSGSGDRTARLWDIETGRARGDALKGHTESVSCLAISPDGKTLAAGSSGGGIFLWDLEAVALKATSEFGIDAMSHQLLPHINKLAGNLEAISCYSEAA